MPRPKVLLVGQEQRAQDLRMFIVSLENKLSIKR
jgi:hypothetical protein